MIKDILFIVGMLMVADSIWNLFNIWIAVAFIGGILMIIGLYGSLPKKNKVK